MFFSDAEGFPYPVDQPYKVDPATGYPTPEVKFYLHICSIVILRLAKSIFSHLHPDFLGVITEASTPELIANCVCVQDCAKHGWAEYQLTEASSAAYQNLYNNSNGE